MPRAGRWGTGRSSPAPPGLATRFGLGTRIKASGVCEPDWAQQRVLAGTSCLGYLDENGSWHPGFSCPAFTFCCGTCHRRYCCGDLNLLLSKWQQKHCQGLSPKALAGVASAVALFVAVVITSLCCCLCTGYHLHRRRQQLHSLFEGHSNDRPCSPAAWLPVPTHWPFPAPTLPGRTPCTQPCSSTPAGATTALLPRSLRSQHCACCPFTDGPAVSWAGALRSTGPGQSLPCAFLGTEPQGCGTWS
ncbi:protein shisa-4 isoform X2 [Rhinolophus sinicus]|uniref:protein shisa-4 isoform X2 n=1 Tax=Rhinolophus sinicus TaxID=89399 RepID=UPI003D79573C